MFIVQKQGISIVVACFEKQSVKSDFSKVSCIRWSSFGRALDILFYFRENRVTEVVLVGDRDKSQLCCAYGVGLERVSR